MAYGMSFGTILWAAAELELELLSDVWGAAHKSASLVRGCCWGSFYIINPKSFPKRLFILIAVTFDKALALVEPTVEPELAKHN